MQILSKRSRYALHGIAYIATHGDGTPVSMQRILEYLKIYSGSLSLSPGYIAKVFQGLTRAGLVHSSSGPHGGYVLARKAEEIHLMEVVEALEGPIQSDCCLLSTGNCPMESTCGVKSIIGEAEAAFHDALWNRSLASLTEKMHFPEIH